MAGKDDDRKASALPWTFAVTPDEALEAAAKRGAEAMPQMRVPPSAADPAPDEELLKLNQRAREITSRRTVTKDFLAGVLDELQHAKGRLRALPTKLRNGLALFLHANRALLEDEELRQAARLAGRCSSEGSPLYAELLFEVMKSGDEAFCSALAMNYLGEDSRMFSLPEDLQDALNEALRSQALPAVGRALAALVLGVSSASFDPAQVKPLLRDRAWMAQLFALAALRSASSLESEDVEVFLGTLVDDERREGDKSLAAMEYRLEELSEALHWHKSAAAAQLLSRLARGLDHETRLISWLEGLELLADVFPDEALPVIDEALHSGFAFARRGALRVLRRFPVEQTIPRLERACTDPVPGNAEAARVLFRLHAMRPDASEPAAVLPAGILTTPPSEAFHRRLLIVRGLDVDSRSKLFELLVGEARAGRAGPEEAALLVTLLCDAAIGAEAPEIDRPEGRLSAWMVTLRPLIGPALGFALVSMARRFGLEYANELLRAVLALNERGLLGTEEHLGAQRWLMEVIDGQGREAGQAMYFLGVLGTAAEGWEPIYEWLSDPERIDGAREALERGPVKVGLVERIERDLSIALDGEREFALVALGITAGSRVAIARGLGIFRQARSETEVKRALKLLSRLQGANALKRSELLGELDAPESPRFELAVRFLCRDEPLEPRTLAALERALAGPNLQAAALALQFLVRCRALSPNDPRLKELLPRIPADSRQLALTGFAYRRDVDLEPLESHYLDALASEDRQLANLMVNVLEDSAAGRAILMKAGWLKEG